MPRSRIRFLLLLIGCCLTRLEPSLAQTPPPQLPEVPVQTLPLPRVLPVPKEADDAMGLCRTIDLPTALRLAGVYNPEILLAHERILEAVAFRQLAAAQILPTLHYGLDVNHHQGPLQQSNGSILNVNRDSMYVGLGAGAVGAGTVNIPGIQWNGDLSNLYYTRLVRQQVVQQRSFESDAVRNDVLLRVAAGYLELLRAHGRHALALQILQEASEVARVTANFAKTGQGRQADADRAATEHEQRKSEVVLAENDMQVASARLGELLRLDPSIRLLPQDSQIVPCSLVPELIPLPELLVIALTQRPELKARQAAIRAALLELQHAKALPFSPQLAIGYSTGTFGGGSNLVTPRFGNFDDRQDLDVVLYWSLRNLGVGNLALRRIAQSKLRQDQYAETIVLDRVRAEVAIASARVQTRFAQLAIHEKAIQSSRNAFQQDLFRTRNREGLPIEVLDSLRLLARSRLAYLDVIIDYNRAHFELYVSLGEPPANTLARPITDEATLPNSLPPAQP